VVVEAVDVVQGHGFSTHSTVRHGLRRLINSVANSPATVSPQGIVEFAADRSDGGADAGFGEPVGERDRGVIRAGILVVDQPGGVVYTKGFKLSTYAAWWILQALIQAVADQTRTIRSPRTWSS
jgi:hypothetical protein